MRLLVHVNADAQNDVTDAVQLGAHFGDTGCGAGATWTGGASGVAGAGCCVAGAGCLAGAGYLQTEGDSANRGVGLL